MLTPKFSLFVLASYFILPIIALLFPNKYVKLIVFVIFLLENILVIGLYIKGKYFNYSSYFTIQ
ncbi:hypothetical protein SFH37_04120 [Streptococcus anginosus]|nr:hypothetical protein [Streptococcus anginosus]MDX5015467.1 hypothetical protein [Streptococcus anginosus]MDX5019545.1 hypothetical protein [Streptococcus anginosus]